MIERLNTALEGRYRIERELGQGGMATVFLADDLKHQRKVAIKVLKPELAAVVGADRFLAEIETTANLQHPHILPLFDSGEADSFLFYVMPYVEGESLRDRLDREQQLPIDEAVRIASDVAEALYAAHERGVIHRDIKPANILLSGGRPLVADFGIALAVSNAGGGRLTETGLSMGTPYYMSPEQASADRDPTQASDQYSLACVLYEMLVGEPPFPGGSAQAVLARILTGEPTPPSKTRKTVPPNVDAVVMRGLEKLPADRFPDAREMVRALRDGEHRYRTGALGSARGGGSAGGRSMLPWGLAAVLAAVAAAGWLTRPDSGQTTPSMRVAIPMEDQSLIPLGPLVSFGIDMVAFDATRDGRTLVHLGWDGERVGLYRRSLDEYESTVIVPSGNPSHPFLSPDGRWVAYFAETGLWKVPIAGGEPVRLANAPNPWGGFWTEEDRIWFSTMEGSRLSSVSASGGEVRVEATEEEYGTPAPLPGNRGWVAAGGEPSSIYVETPDGVRKRLVDGIRPQVLASGHLIFVRGRTLYAAGFDLERLEVTSAPVPVLEGIRSQAGSSSYRVTDDGTLFYLPGVYADIGVAVLVDAEGKADTLSLPPAIYGHLALSPQLDRIATYALTSEFEMRVYDLESGRSQLLDRAAFFGQGIWSRTGDRIAYSRETERDGPWELVIRQPESTAETVVMTSEIQVVVSDWSADGSAVLIAAYAPERGGRIALQPTEPGSEAQVLVDTEGDDWGAVFSPDGNWIAYTSDRSGTYEVYLMPYPPLADGGAIKISTQPNSEEPHWSFDGNAVLYRSGSRWWRAPIRFTPAPAIGTPEPLIEGAFLNVPGKSWDLLPDGRLLLADGPRDATVNRINMIPNFISEIATRIGGR